MVLTRGGKSTNRSHRASKTSKPVVSTQPKCRFDRRQTPMQTTLVHLPSFSSSSSHHSDLDPTEHSSPVQQPPAPGSTSATRPSTRFLLLCHPVHKLTPLQVNDSSLPLVNKDSTLLAANLYLFVMNWMCNSLPLRSLGFMKNSLRIIAWDY